MNMEKYGFESKKIKTNQEIIAETRKEYPKFKNFWDDVLKQAKEKHSSGIYLGDNPAPLHIVCFFASKLTTIKRWNDLYITNGLEEDPKAEMPVIVYKNCMNMLQRAMGEASDFYHGEMEILDDEGRIKDKM